MQRTTKILLTISTAALFASACNPEIGGEEGNLALTYDEGPVAGATGSSPLAVGANLDYSAHLEGKQEQKVSFTSAMSDDDQIIRVHGTDGGLMTLTGVAEGAAMIDVEAEGPDGEPITDAFELETATVDEVEFANPCAPDAEALYLVDHDIRLHYTMRSEGSVAVGYGYYPIAVEPIDGASLGQTTQNGVLPLHTGTTPGQVELSTTIDDTAFTLTLAEPGDIDGAQVFEQEFVNGNLPVAVGDSLSVRLLPTVSGLLPQVQEPVPVCQADIDIEATTSTSDICEVAYEPNPNASEEIFHLYETNVLTVTGKAEGTCEISVTIPDADGGNGVTETFSVDVAQSSDAQNDQDS